MEGPLPLDIAIAGRDQLRWCVDMYRESLAAKRPLPRGNAAHCRERDEHELAWLEEALLRSWRGHVEAL